jgi:hypothetical protein
MEKQNNSMRASAPHITFISLLTVLLPLGAVSAGNQFERKPSVSGVPLRNPQQRAMLSGSSAAAKQANMRKSAGAKFLESEFFLQLSAGPTA